MLIFDDDQLGRKRGSEREEDAGKTRKRERVTKGGKRKSDGERKRERDGEYARYSARLGAALANFFVVDDCSDAKSLQVLSTSIFDPLVFLLFTYILFSSDVFSRIFFN